MAGFKDMKRSSQPRIFSPSLSTSVAIATWWPAFARITATSPSGAGADILVVSRAIAVSKNIQSAAEEFLKELNVEEIDPFRVMTDSKIGHGNNTLPNLIFEGKLFRPIQEPCLR